jgi:hypothetical protein
MRNMGSSPLRQVGAIAVFAATLWHAMLAGAATTPNLLVNGDAERQRCTADWTAQSSIPGWRVLRGAASVLCYRAFDDAKTVLQTPSKPSAGNALFAAPGGDTSMEQAVDIAWAGHAVDAGAVGFNLSGWLGGWGDRPESATLTATFLDADGNATGAPVVLARAGATERGNSTALLQRQARGHVPAKTRRVVLTLQFLSGMSSFQNAYADNLSLRLSGPLDGIGPRPAPLPPVRVPALDHVYVVMMENTNYADVVHTRGASATVDAGMPFLASLARRGVLLTNAWQTYHPSDQNYVAMVAGDTFKYGPVYYPDYDLPVNHLGDLVEASGKTWRGYVQDMGTPCNLTSTGEGRRSFSPDDEPFVHFENVIGNPSRCTASLRDMTDFATAIAADTLPDFAWIAANDWWDGEGAWSGKNNVAFSNAKQDQFLRRTLEPLLNAAAWQSSRSLLIVTWDESNGWGWPDNHVPTFLIGSPGLLHDGAVLHVHASGYDLLRTIEDALEVGNLDRFDQFARPLSEVFAASPADDEAAHRLWPAESVTTRGGIDDTFGRSGTPAAVKVGRPLDLTVPAGVGATAYVNLEPIGKVPNATSTKYAFNSDRTTVSIPTTGLAPGFYGAWLRSGGRPAPVAPLTAQILPPPQVSPAAPGVEIVGAPRGGGSSGKPALREGSNPIVHYCLAAGMTPAESWVGIFPAGTPSDQMTKAHANRIGYWLKTPTDGLANQRCGEAEAYVSELSPRLDYRVLLFRDLADGTSTPVGRSAGFTVIPALPH